MGLANRVAVDRKRRADTAVTRNIQENISCLSTDRYAVHLHVGYMITCIRSDRIGLTAAVVYRRRPGRSDCSVRSMCFGNRVAVDRKRRADTAVTRNIQESISCLSTDRYTVHLHVGYMITCIGGDCIGLTPAVVYRCRPGRTDRAVRSMGFGNRVAVDRKRRADTAVTRNIQESISWHSADRYTVHQHVGYMITGSGGDCIGLTPAVVYRRRSGRTDRTVRSMGLANRVA